MKVPGAAAFFSAHVKLELAKLLRRQDGSGDRVLSHREGGRESSSTLSKPMRPYKILSYWLQTKLFNFWGSYKVVDSESFTFYSLGCWASEL